MNQYAHLHKSCKVQFLHWEIHYTTTHTLLGFLMLGAAWLVLKLWPVAGDAAFIAHKTQTFEYALMGLAIFHLTMVLTVAFGCVIVMIMKGPQYTSDSYPVQDAERPLR